MTKDQLYALASEYGLEVFHLEERQASVHMQLRPHVTHQTQSLEWLTGAGEAFLRELEEKRPVGVAFQARVYTWEGAKQWLAADAGYRG